LLLPDSRFETREVHRLLFTESLGRHVDMAKVLQRHVSWMNMLGMKLIWLVGQKILLGSRRKTIGLVFVPKYISVNLLMYMVAAALCPSSGIRTGLEAIAFAQSLRTRISKTDFDTSLLKYDQLSGSACHHSGLRMKSSSAHNLPYSN
jgi:hypothetical protein